MLCATEPEIHRLPIADCDDVAFGPDGDLYLACHSPEGQDEMNGYVMRFDPRTKKVIFTTRLGGDGFDAALRVRVDRNGMAHATGITKSRNFPVTPDATQKQFGGGASDAFLAAVAPDGKLVYSSFLGGVEAEVGNALDVDGKGRIAVGGTKNADAFVCLAAADMVCKTFGGAKEEKLTGLVFDGKDGVYATGYTTSADFPVKLPLQRDLAGPMDAFLTRFAIPSMEVTFSTFFGGEGDDSGWGVTMDGRNNPVIAGITKSAALPGAAKGFQSRNGGKSDAFIAIFRQGAVISTYFGGAEDDESGYDGGNIQAGSHGTIWLAGGTQSHTAPGGGNMDGFIAAFSGDLKRLCYASYHGETGKDLLEGIAVSKDGQVAASGVSFGPGPSANRVQLGKSEFFAGAVVVTFAEGKNASRCK